jgi:DNA repair exonuclease SbcCD ATPase subunit
LKVQQESEDRKNEFINNDLEKKVKNLEDLLKEKNSRLESAEASLAEARLWSEKQDIQITDQNKQVEKLSKELECKENGPQAIWLIEFWCLMINTICGLIYLLVL